MPIQIIDGSQVKQGPIVAVLYGQPGVGKTSLALTATKPVLLDFDVGARRAANRAGKAVVEVADWGDIAGLKAPDIAEYQTLVIDTVGACLEALIRDIIRLDPSMGSGGALKIQGYGKLKTRFKQWLGSVKAIGKDVILVAHMAEETRGERTFERIEAVGSSRNYVYQCADLMGRLMVEEESGKRHLSFNPSVASYGKNPGLPDSFIPPPSKDGGIMARIIAAAKAKLESSPAEPPASSMGEQLAGAALDSGPPPTPPPPTEEPPERA